jgi:hypothetical protein
VTCNHGWHFGSHPCTIHYLQHHRRGLIISTAQPPCNNSGSKSRLLVWQLQSAAGLFRSSSQQLAACTCVTAGAALLCCWLVWGSGRARACCPPAGCVAPSAASARGQPKCNSAGQYAAGPRVTRSTLHTIRGTQVLCGCCMPVYMTVRRQRKLSRS